MSSFTMPNVGEGVTEGEVTRWLKVESEFVARDEPVVDVETDKAVVEIPSPFEGTLARILVREGEIVPVGTPLGEIEEGADAAVTAPAPQAPRAAPRAPEPEPERVAPVPAAAAAPEPAVAAPAAVPSAAPAASFTQAPAAPYSPAVLKLARQQGVDLAAVPGTGRGGRVTRKDVLRYLEHAQALAAAAAPAAPAQAPAAETPAAAPSPATAATPGTVGPSTTGGELVRLSATRRAVARHMAESHATIPLAWMAIEADVTGLVALRQAARDAFEQTHGVRLTFMPFFVQAIARALGEHPELNSTYTEDGLLRHERFDLGIAVATDAGLLVPVLRDANRLGLPELARAIEDLATRARDRTLTHEELQGGTLTVDNTGAFVSLISQPIVPVGQVAIVTTEAIRRELRIVGDADSDAFAPRSVMHLAISFDHRALDGAEVGAFMADLTAHLEAYAPGQPLE